MTITLKYCTYTLATHIMYNR